MTEASEDLHGLSEMSEGEDSNSEATPLSSISPETKSEVLFSQSGVFTKGGGAAGRSPNHLPLVPGTLTLEMVPRRGLVVFWRPLNEGPPSRRRGISEGDGADWTVVVQGSKAPELPDRSRWLDVEVTEVNSMRITDDGNKVVLIQKDGGSSQALIFLGEGSDEFIKRIKIYRNVRKSVSDDSLFLLRDPQVEDIDRTLSELNLFDSDGTSRLDTGGSEAVWNFVAQIQKDPYTTALTAFSKLTDKLVYSQSQEFRPEDEVAELLQQSMIAPDNVIETTEDGDYEVVTPRPSLLEDLPAVSPRDEPLCQLDWELHFDGDGRMIDQKEVMMKVFRGGVMECIRPEVWKYLLGYYDPDMTYTEREEFRNKKVNDYHRMKLQWTTISPSQEKNFSSFSRRRNQIDKDVLRTDRSHAFFAGEDNPNLRALNDVLMTYVMYNFDLGYVQGMSDLLSPLLFVMGNEVDAFWCFVGFMDKVKSNFDLDQGGMKKQLEQLVTLERAMDPELFHYLSSNESGNFYFAFRWLLIWFKREFSFGDILKLWEALWSGVMCTNFHLLVCLALLHNEKTTIMENRFGLTEILKHINDLAYRIDVDSTLEKAEAIQLKLAMAETEERAKEAEEVTSEQQEAGSEPQEDARRIRKLTDILHGRLSASSGTSSSRDSINSGT